MLGAMSCVITPMTATSDSHNCTCHSHLGRCNKNENNPICVALPKVAMASTMVTVTVAGVIA